MRIAWSCLKVNEGQVPGDGRLVPSLVSEPRAHPIKIRKSVKQSHGQKCTSCNKSADILSSRISRKLLKDKLQRSQTRAARVILGANHDTHSVDLLNMLSWDTLENRRSGA